MQINVYGSTMLKTRQPMHRQMEKRLAHYRAALQKIIHALCDDYAVRTSHVQLSCILRETAGRNYNGKLGINKTEIKQ